MSDPAGPVQFSLGDLGGPFGKFSDHSERWTKRTTKTAWSSPEAFSLRAFLRGGLSADPQRGVRWRRGRLVAIR